MKRAESPRLRIAQGKRSDALGKPLALRHALLRAKACLIDSVSTLLPLFGRAVLTPSFSIIWLFGVFLLLAEPVSQAHHGVSS